MIQKRVLIILDDPLLANLYSERLDAAGFLVRAINSGENVLGTLAEHHVDAVVLGPLLSAPETAGVITTVRSQDAFRALPLIVLPCDRAPLADAALSAGATRVLDHGVNPMANLIDTIESIFDLERTHTHEKSLPFHADNGWSKISFDSAPATLTAMRRTLHGISRDSADRQAMRAMLQLIHNFTGQMALLAPKALYQLAAAVEALVFEIFRAPEHANASTLRTLGQALDFLPTLLTEANRSRLKDPASAQVLVVDDEDGARKIIMASLHLVNLKSIAADTPSASLAALGIEGFELIFLDVGLPEMNGFDLCTKVRAIPMHEKTPIVFITGMATLNNRVQSNLSGGNDFVGKPFSIAELGLKALIWVFKGQLGLV